MNLPLDNSGKPSWLSYPGTSRILYKGTLYNIRGTSLSCPQSQIGEEAYLMITYFVRGIRDLLYFTTKLRLYLLIIGKNY